MLSRVAERMYWGARYLERAENTARLVRVYDAALMDLPEQAGIGWPLLVEICGAREAFSARYPNGGNGGGNGSSAGGLIRTTTRTRTDSSR